MDDILKYKNAPLDPVNIKILPSEFLRNVQAISRQYLDLLDREISEEDILLKLVLESNSEK